MEREDNVGVIDGLHNPQEIVSDSHSPTVTPQTKAFCAEIFRLYSKSMYSGVFETSATTYRERGRTVD